MRTTLTLDPDLAAALQDRARRTGRTWKQVVNDTLRAGLTVRAAPREPYRTPVHDPGPSVLPDTHSVYEMLVIGEGDDFR